MFKWLEYFSSSARPSDELPVLFPLPIENGVFVAIDVKSIYSRILTDTLERTYGIAEKYIPLLWDNCLASESQEGLVTMLAEAMYEKRDLFLVFDQATSVIRKATEQEKRQIQDDYAKQAKSSVGIFITFRKYTRTDMLKLYSGLEYCAIGGLWKGMNISTAVQLKFSDMRASVSLIDSGEAKAQAVSMSMGLSQGRAIAMDAKDSVETATPQMEATTNATTFIETKKAFYLGMPPSYMMSANTKSSLGDTGEGNAKEVERGLKAYYFSIVKPVVEELFGSKTSFKSEDFYGLSQSLEALKTFELTSESLISYENKLVIVNKLFGLPEDSEGDEPPLEEVQTTTQSLAKDPENPRTL